MRRKLALQSNLNYLRATPKTIWWKVIAGPPKYKLNTLMDHDLVFDDYDLKIRRVDNIK